MEMGLLEVYLFLLMESSEKNEQSVLKVQSVTFERELSMCHKTILFPKIFTVF